MYHSKEVEKMIKIITDSSSDLDIKTIKELDIDLLEIKLADKNGEEIKDYIDSLEMFARQENGEVFKTSQISSYEYIKKFEEYAREGTKFICITLSSGLSGCYQSAALAKIEIEKKYSNAKFTLLDSQSASVGLGLIVYLVAKAAKNNMEYEKLVDFSKFLIENIEHIFTVFDLKYLYEGGRLSKTTKTISTILNIMPVLEVDKEHKLSIKEIIRGKNKAYKKMLDIIKNKTKGREISEDIIMPVYGRDFKDINPFIENLKEYGFKNIMPHRIGTTIASHIGPEIIGAGYLKKEIPEEYKSYLRD